MNSSLGSLIYFPCQGVRVWRDRDYVRNDGCVFAVKKHTRGRRKHTHTVPADNIRGVSSNGKPPHFAWCCLLLLESARVRLLTLCGGHRHRHHRHICTHAACAIAFARAGLTLDWCVRDHSWTLVWKPHTSSAHRLATINRNVMYVYYLV